MSFRTTRSAGVQAAWDVRRWAPVASRAAGPFHAARCGCGAWIVRGRVLDRTPECSACSASRVEAAMAQRRRLAA
jgi:hypothetical protein